MYKKITDDVILLAEQHYRNLDLLQSGLICFELTSDTLIENDESNDALNRIISYILYLCAEELLLEIDYGTAEFKEINLNLNNFMSKIKDQALESIFTDVIPVGLIYLNRQCDVEYLCAAIDSWVCQMKLHVKELFT